MRTPEEPFVLPLGSGRPYGSLEQQYRTAYRRLVQATPSAETVVILEPLARAVTAHVPLGDGLEARFTFLPGRDAWSKTTLARTIDNDRTLLRLLHEETELAVLARRLPYVPEHSLLIPSYDLLQDLDHTPLGAAFVFACALGHSYTSFFNKGGMTYNRFHAQCFRGAPPLWGAVEQGSAPILDERCCAGGVRRGWVGRWPALAQALRSSDVPGLTVATISEVRRLEALGLTYDLTWRPIGEELCVLIFVRGRSTDDEFDSYSVERKELGMFGALEQSGWIVSIKDESLFTRLVNDPEELARRYSMALLDMRPTWWPDE